MRRVAAIGMGAIVLVSLVPWLRHLRSFWTLTAFVALAVWGLLVFSDLRRLSAWLGLQRVRQDRAENRGRSRSVRGWLLPGGIVVALMFTVPHYMATSSGAYKLAVSTASQTPQFREALGVPVKEAWFSEGKFRWGERGSAELLIPVHGHLGSGNLRVVAVKDDGRWKLTELVLELEHPERRIDLLSPSR